MDVSRFKPAIVYTIYIAATPEQVWQALISAEFTRQYFHGLSVEIEPKIGGAFAIHLPDGTPHITGEVLAFDPPRQLTVTWDLNWPGLREAIGHETVTYLIEPAGEAVRLTLTEAHERELDDDILSGGRTGWPAILSGLKSVLETGHAPKIEMAAPAKMLAALRRLGVEVPEM